jgi:acyl-CoA synthetase (AMP-forming)/AMP-acid ligase II
MTHTGMQELSGTLGAMLERQAALYPGKDFISFPDRNLRFTYSTFDARVNTLARGLVTIGIGKGDLDSYPMTASGKIQKYKLRESAPALLQERGVEVA